MENQVKLVGVSTGEMKVNHTFTGTKGDKITVLETDILYTSTKNITNRIRVLVYQNSKYANMLSKPRRSVKITGVLQSFNKNDFGKRVTEVFVKPNNISELSVNIKHKNSIEITGEICGDTTLKPRTTGRVVTEAKLKVKRLNQEKYDYIPIVAFENEAIKLSTLKNGDIVSITGRLHSRTFDFNYEEDKKVKKVSRTTLEVGSYDIEVVERKVEKIQNYSLKSFQL